LKYLILTNKQAKKYTFTTRNGDVSLIKYIAKVPKSLFFPNPPVADL